ncbi:hypothetical protein [Paenibacillus sp. YYML68]|uniref:hypothetical protein n=1 Tax=Paenibacillus sp. YYML68 TaxID=2909250 RepID=UPI002491C688|nr:hypothetical protein [Paenibacillus sp. YYML68]
MYNQQFQNNLNTSSYNNTLPYQRTQVQAQSAFQPTGYVQSFYNTSQQQQFGAYPSSQSYHMPNYRGNELGHDSSLRENYFTPTQQQGAMASQPDFTSARYGIRGNEQAFQNVNNTASQYGFNNPLSSTTSYNTNTSYGQGLSSYNANTAYNQNINQSYNQGISSYTPSTAYGQSSYSQPVSADSYHMANYRGNQLGHDASIRENYFTPAQQGAMTSQPDYTSPRYGIRGNEQAYQSINNTAPQFGFGPSPYNSISSSQNLYR